MQQEMPDSTDFTDDTTITSSSLLKQLWTEVENLSIPEERKKPIRTAVSKMPVERQAATLQNILRGIQASADSIISRTTDTKIEPSIDARAAAFAKAERRVADTFDTAAIEKMAQADAITIEECRRQLVNRYALGYLND